MGRRRGAPLSAQRPRLELTYWARRTPLSLDAGSRTRTSTLKPSRGTPTTTTLSTRRSMVSMRLIADLRTSCSHGGTTRFVRRRSLTLFETDTLCAAVPVPRFEEPEQPARGSPIHDTVPQFLPVRYQFCLSAIVAHRCASAGGTERARTATSLTPTICGH